MADLRIAFVDNSVMDSVANKLKTYVEAVMTELPANYQAALFISSAHRGSSGVDFHENMGTAGALDIAAAMDDTGMRAMQALARILIRDADLLYELIHATDYSDDHGFEVKFGVVQPEGWYGSTTLNAHKNHIHLATDEDWGTALVARHPKASGGGPAPTPVGSGVLYGYDGSDFTHVMDFSGLSFVTHKVTEAVAGNEIYRHTQFGPVMASARDQGISFLGAYVVPRTGGYTPVQEAQIAIDEVAKQAPWLYSHPGFFWQVDLEKWDYDKVEVGEGAALAAALRSLSGKYVMLYASKGQYGDSIPGDDPLWNANYNGSGASRPFKEMYTPDGEGWQSYSGRTPIIWQYASDARFADGNIGDANAFKGNEDDFRRLVLGGTTGTPGGFNMSELERQANNADHYGWAIVDERDAADIIVDGQTVFVQNKLKERLVRIEAKLDEVKPAEIDYTKLVAELIKALKSE